MDERVARYLDHVRFEKRLAERTSTLYALDLQKLSELALAANVDLAQVGGANAQWWPLGSRHCLDLVWLARFLPLAGARKPHCSQSC
jgi:hypothetical protein